MLKLVLIGFASSLGFHSLSHFSSMPGVDIQDVTKPNSAHHFYYLNLRLKDILFRLQKMWAFNDASHKNKRMKSNALVGCA